jgi:ribonuclease inhibitor
MIVEVLGVKIHTERDFHHVLARQHEFGEYYGWNLAALRDRLLTGVPRPVKLIWHDAGISRQQLGAAEFDAICRILADAEDQDRRCGWEDRFTYGRR